MIKLTIIWLALPFLLGFVVYLLPKLDRCLSLITAFISLAYAMQIFVV